MQKDQIIQQIKTIIADHGTFDIGSLVDPTIPSLSHRGNLIALLESFSLDNAIVVVYNNAYSIVDTYRLSYIDMALDTLKQVLDVCLLYGDAMQYSEE